MEKTKKLKLYGRKDDNWHFIATVFVKDNEVVVEAKNSQVKEELLKEIKKAEMLGFIALKRSVETEHGWKFQEKLQKRGDTEFLEALQDCNFLWKTDKKYGGYVIYGHRAEIVED